MIGELKPYPRMKDSGVEWLGEVPEHWDVLPLGQFGRFSKGRGGTKEDEVDSGVPCVRYGDLYTRHEFFIERTKGFVAQESASSYTAIRYGDVLFAGSGETIEEIGKSAVCLISEPACCGGDISIFRPSVPVDARFLGLATDCPSAAAQKSRLGRGITVMHIYGDELKYVTVALPPCAEQVSIVRYLDYVDRRIRRLLRAKRKLIALLDEQKQAIIHRAVTRGLDPDVKMKDSGVEWLGEVPAHWEIRRSKHLFTTSVEKAREGDVQLSATQAYGVIAQSDYESRIGRKVVRITHHLDKRKHVEKDDFVISMRSFQGGLERAWTAGCIRSSYVVLRSSTEIDVSFFALLFKTQRYIGGLQATADFVRDGQDLSFENFAAVPLPFPPLGEQWKIVSELERELEQARSVIGKAQSEISLLEELRSRLTADVVTGKLDVREAVAALPEVDQLDVEDFDEQLDPEAEDLEDITEDADA